MGDVFIYPITLVVQGDVYNQTTCLSGDHVVKYYIKMLSALNEAPHNAWGSVGMGPCLYNHSKGRR
jgi:hypothetical protein